MNLSLIVRQSGCLLIASLALVAQRASSLPFWDNAISYYPVPTSSNYVFLSGMTNSEGNVWAPIGSNQAPNSASDVAVVNYPLSYPGLECSAQNAFEFGETPSSTNYYSERIPIHPPMLAGLTFTGGNAGYQITNGYLMKSDTIYYSFIFQIGALGSLPTTGSFICGFNTLVGPQPTAISYASGRLYFELSGTTNYTIGIGANTSAASGATFVPGMLFNTNSTNFVVVAYTFVPGNGGSNNYAQIWVNPDPSTFGAAVPPTPSATNANNAGGLGSGAAVNQVMSFYWRQGNSLEPLVYAADLRIGYCWGCVTPPAVNPAPQAATLSVAAVSSNLNIVSLQTNTPCYLMQTSTNLPYTSNTWALVSTPPSVSGGNYNVTNVVPAITNLTVVGSVTNTNITSVPAVYYNVKTYAN